MSQVVKQDGVLMVGNNYNRNTFRTHTTTVCEKEVDTGMQNFSNNENIGKSFEKFKAVSPCLAVALANTRLAGSPAAAEVSQLIYKYTSFLHNSNITLDGFILSGLTCLQIHTRAYTLAQRHRFDRSLRELTRCKEIATKNEKKTVEVLKDVQDLINICEASAKQTMASSMANKKDKDKATLEIAKQEKLIQGFEEEMKIVKQTEKELNDRIKETYRQAEETRNLEEKKMVFEFAARITESLIGGITLGLGSRNHPQTDANGRSQVQKEKQPAEEGEQTQPAHQNKSFKEYQTQVNSALNQDSSKFGMAQLYELQAKLQDLKSKSAETELKITKSQHESLAIMAASKVSKNDLEIAIKALGLANAQLGKVKVAVEGVKEFFSKLRQNFDTAIADAQTLINAAKDAKEDVSFGVDDQIYLETQKIFIDEIKNSALNWTITTKACMMAEDVVRPLSSKTDHYVENMPLEEELEKYTQDMNDAVSDVIKDEMAALEKNVNGKI